MDYIKIFDTTLRDGEQSPGCSMNIEEKVRLALQLEKLGVDVIEAGFPIASPDDFSAVKEIASRVIKAEICGLSRALEKDIKTAWNAIKKAKKPRIHTFLATSDIHLKYKLKMSKDEALKRIRDIVAYAKSLCDRVDFSPEDATRSDFGFLFEVLSAAVEAGADTLNIPDTVGYAIPVEFTRLIQEIIKNVQGVKEKGIIISTHCHDDLGLAGANSLAGVLAGARQIECTINGIGERAGNASLEEVVMALKTRKDLFHLRHGINTKEIYRTSRLLTQIIGVEVQPNKAIVGANAFAHEAGIHQHGILQERKTYEIMKSSYVGIDKSSLVLGKHSGRHALAERLKELGFTLDMAKLDRIFERFKALADKKKNIYDEDMVLLAEEEQSDVEPYYKLKTLNVVCGTHGLPTASVALEDKEKIEYRASAIGSGPVDAAYQAINQIVKVKAKLLEFSMKAVTEGIDAQAEVTVKVEINDKIYFGRGSNTDIVIGSAKAYLAVLNKYLARQT